MIKLMIFDHVLCSDVRRREKKRGHIRRGGDK